MADVVKQQQEPMVGEGASCAERQDSPRQAIAARSGETLPVKASTKEAAPAVSSTAEGQQPVSAKQAGKKQHSVAHAEVSRPATQAAAPQKTGKQPAAKTDKAPSSVRGASSPAGRVCAEQTLGASRDESGTHADVQTGQKADPPKTTAGSAAKQRNTVKRTASKPIQTAAVTGQSAMLDRRGTPVSSGTAVRTPAKADGADKPSGDEVLAEALRHGAHVAELTGALFDQLQDLHGLDAGWRGRLLEAARLHDIGFVSGRKGHHKASMRRILEDTTLKLSAEDRPLIALLARYHRKAWPSCKHSQFAALPRATRKALRRATALLRVADGLDYTHQALVAGLTVRVKSRRVVLVLRCKVECPQEMKRAVRKGDLFAHVFGVQVECACQPD